MSDPLPQDFRLAMRCFADSVCLITAGSGSGLAGCTASSVRSFSVDPPVMSFSLHEDGSTARALRAEGPVGISLLRHDQEAVARRFARHDLGIAERLGQDAWETLHPDGGLVLTDALASMACVIDTTLVRHAHVLVLVRVVAVRCALEAVPPLLYCQRDYRRLDTLA